MSTIDKEQQKKVARILSDRILSRGCKYRVLCHKNKKFQSIEQWCDFCLMLEIMDKRISALEHRQNSGTMPPLEPKSGYLGKMFAE